MTIEKQLNLPENWGMLRDEELIPFLAPMFPRTRPNNPDVVKDMVEDIPGLTELMAEVEAKRKSAKFKIVR